MEEEQRKPIHILIDEPSEGVAQLCEKLGESAPVICDDIKKISSEEKVLLVNDSNEIVWSEKLVGNIHSAHVNHPALEYLIKRSIDGEFSVDLSESYEDFDKEVYSYRFIDPFEEGEIADIIAQKILDSGFDPLPFRSYFTSIMGYLAHHAKRENIALPIDVQLGIFQGCFVVQVMAGNNSFSVEQIKESFGHTDVNNLYSSLLDSAFHSTHIMEINRVDKASKLLVTGIWCHDQYKLPGGTFLVQNVDTLKKYVAKKASLELLPNKHQSTFSELKLSGTTARRYSDEESIFTSDPALLKKVIDHVSAKIENEKLDTPNDIVSLKEMLKDFDSLDELANFSKDEYENALRALKDVSTKELFDANYEYALENLEDDDLFTHLMETANELEKDDSDVISGDIEEDDFSQVVSGDDDDDLFKQVVSGKSKEDKHQQVIKGEKEDLAPSNTLVKGKKETADKSKMVIKGGGEDPLKNKGVFNNRLSENSSKKNDQLIKATQKLHQFKDELDSVEDIEVAMLEYIIDEVGGSRSAAGEMLKEVITFSKTQSINKKVNESSQIVRDKLQNERFAQELAKRDNQIERMKTVVKKLQEHAAQATKPKKNVAKSIDDMDDIGSPEAPDEKLNVLDGEDPSIQLKTLKVDLASKNAQLRKLESQLEHFKERSGDNSEALNELQNLKKENAALQSQVDLQASRNENMSERMSQQAANATGRDTSELSKFRERISSIESDKQQLKDQLTRLDFSHREMSKKLQEKENEILRLRQASTESSAQDTDGNKELEKELEQLKQKERSSTHEAKAQALKLRQLEQKLKFAQAQIDKQSSRSSGVAAAATGSSNNEKRLEKINQKLADGMKAQSVEIAEKKKEAIKFKAENNQLLHKITDLERQLAKLTKKAA